MLQQTRVETVIPYFNRFLHELPTVSALARAPEEQVLALWSGLGYYRRARMLHAAAQDVARRHGGTLPSELSELRSLAGVGAYTAGAVASIAFGRRAAVVDGNVSRALARIYAVEEDVKTARGRARLWQLADRLLPDGDVDPGDWNQALMELGATVCLPRAPQCHACPVCGECAAKEKGLVDAIPRSSPKPRPRELLCVAVVLASSRAVVLARRRPSQLFGGLWEPPTSSVGVEAMSARLGIAADELRPMGQVTHVLTHRRMLVEVFRGAIGRRRRFSLPGPEYDAIETVDVTRVGDRGQAALARRILEVAKV
jgi:A/G-specific adenine glycosylase